jgi:hypothetical protein
MFRTTEFLLTEQLKNKGSIIHTVIALALKGEMEKQLLLNDGVVIELSKQ